MKFYAISILSLLTTTKAFSPVNIISVKQQSTELSMAMDSAMVERLNGIKRSYQALTERLGDLLIFSSSPKILAPR